MTLETACPKQGKKEKKPRKPIKKKKRTPAEDLRIYGPDEFSEFLHAHACMGCGVVGYSEQAHVHTGGKGRKDDWTRTLPLCGRRVEYGEMIMVGLMYVAPRRTVMGCHHDYDNAKQSWPAARGLDMDELQREFFAEWSARCAEGG